MSIPATRSRVKLCLPVVTSLLLSLIQQAPPPVAQEAGIPGGPDAVAPRQGAPASSIGPVDYVKDREAIFDAFYRTDLDTSKPLGVSNLTIRKDNMVLLLKAGTLFLMKPIAGEVTGAAFIGDGLASMTPPNRTERYMLKKYYDAEVLNEPFTEAVFRFSDGSGTILAGAAKPDPGGSARAERATAVFKDRNGLLSGSREIGIEMQFLENRLSNLKGQDFFVAEFNSEKHKWIGYMYNPSESIENVLYTRDTMGAKDKMYRVIWTDWHKASDYAGGHCVVLPDKDGPQTLRVRHYDVDLNVKTLKTVEWEARLRIEPLITNLHALRFDLANNAHELSHWDDTNFYPIRLASVADAEGKPLIFMHRRDQVLVSLPQPTLAGEPLTLVFRGSADVIDQLTAESFGLLQAPWYPQYGYLGGRYTFHWTVRVPQGFTITGSGDIVREFADNDNGQVGIEFKCDKPAEFPWVIFGRFQKASSTYVSQEGPQHQIAMTIHSFPRMTVPITDKEVLDYIGAGSPISLDLTAPSKRIDGFFDEGKEILKLFEKIYGPYPYGAIHIAQMAPFLGFGQAPQGFVQLTGEAFMAPSGGAKIGGQIGGNELLLTYDFGDFIHGFLSHEFAHQWWAHKIGWATSDDQWLSESFAEYAAGLFVKEYQGPKRFQRTLEEWRRDAKLSDPEAPIAAANTLRGPNAGRNRNNLLYKKGPYVLHMLRVQLDDADYVKVMRSILQTYENQNISTEMMVHEVNRVTGQDYTSFFDQWFWDVGIPKFRYSWRSEKQADGKFLITVHVAQEDKSHPKRVLMPIYIQAKGATIPPQYRPVVQPEQDIRLVSPVEPKDVTLDDERTLLAEFVKAG